MLRYRSLRNALCLLCVLLASCGGKSNDNSSGRVRIVNALSGATISVTVDSTVLAPSLGFEQFTGYQSVSSGTREFKVSANGGSTNVIDMQFSVNSGTDYTFVVYGPVSAAASVLLNDSFTTPSSGQFLFRVSNLAAGIGPVDAYVTAPGADLSVTSPSVAGIPYGSTNAFATLNAGSYELRLTSANTKDVIFDSVPRSFAEKTANQAIVYSKGSGRLGNVIGLDNNGNAAVADNLLAEFKVVNASQVTSSLNFFVDGTLALSNVPPAGVSAYQKVPAGTRNITVESSATPGATLLTVAPTLASGTATSIAVVGTAGALSPLVLTDNDLPPAAGRARVRIVNASPDFGSVDVFVNFSRQVTGLTTGGASSYLDFAADLNGTSYEFDFNMAGATSSSLVLPGVSLVAGKTYTIYMIGPASALRGVVSRDT